MSNQMGQQQIRPGEQEATHSMNCWDGMNRMIQTAGSGGIITQLTSAKYKQVNEHK